MIACDVVRKPSRGHEVAMEDLRSEGVEGCVVPPLTQVKGVEGGSADVAGRRGGWFGKWMGACWFLESTQNNGGAP